jgi:hypothetical protein
VTARKNATTRAPAVRGIVASALALALSTLPLTAGCGGEEEWEPTGVGPQIETETGALSDPMAGAQLGGDMVAMPGGDVERVQSALSGGNGKTGEPKVFYLFYADGKDLPDTDIDACKGVPPKFNCTFAPTLAECQRQIQTYLDKWYADFNIVFTLTRPTSGKFYTEVVSSGGGAWCDVSPKVAGVAPFLCKDLDGGVAYTFLGGTSAKQTAIIIAQEQAHLVGLEHTMSGHDLMYPSICTDCDAGFADQELAVDGDRCDRPKQNSYQMMKDRLGAWPGGPKPSVFGCVNDLRPPAVSIVSPAANAQVKKNFTLKVNASDDCNLASVQVNVDPLKLKTESFAPPFEWDLTNITGQQTITITAIDSFGHVTKESITVTAPMETSMLGDGKGTAGCAVASSAFGLAGLLPAVGVLLLFARRRARPRRRRALSGALDVRASAKP